MMTVLEVAPTHWETPFGLWSHGVVPKQQKCRSMPVDDASAYTTEEAFRLRDYSELIANYRNRAIERGLLGSSIKMLRTWRALVPISEHRSMSDCTHLGPSQLVHVARSLFAFLDNAGSFD